MTNGNGKVNYKLSGVAASAVLLLMSSTSLFAQNADSDDDDLTNSELLMEQIIVTARKKDEALNTVPVAVTALSGAQMEALFVNNVEDVTYMAPNAEAQVNGTFPAYVNFFIRGMGVAGTVLSDDPAVGVFVDGIYSGLSAGVALDVFDLEAVEVLRGPQGTLFGRNVTGGAALIHTRKPTEEFDARVRLIGGNNGRAEGAVSISGPLSENFLGKLVAFYKTRDDWMDNPSGNAMGFDDLGEMEQKVLRGAATWIISDTSTADFRFEFGEDDSDPRPIWAEKNDALLGAQPIPGISEAPVRKGSDPLANGVTTSPIASDWSNASVEFNFGIGSGNLQSLTGWRTIEQKNLTQDFDGSVVALFDINNGFLDQDQFSQEFVYNMVFDNGTELTTGVYYFDQTYKYGEHRFGALFATLGGGLTTNSTTDHEVLGAFAQADIKMGDSWVLTLGGRFSTEEKKTQIGQFASGLLDGTLNCTDFVSTNPADCPPNFSGKEDWSNFTPKVGVQYFMSDTTMLYGSWSQGFRSGGFNIRQNVGALPGPYDEEKVDAFEVGIKSDTADGRFRLNAALFYNDYTDLQRTVITSEGFQTVSNAAAATIQGAEFEATWLATENLVFQASLGLLDTELKDFVNPGTGVLIDGTNMPFVPDHQFTISGNYDLVLSSGVVSFRALYHKEDNVETTDDNLGFPGPSWDTIDASVSYAPQNGDWRVTLFGRNLDDSVVSHQVSSAIYSGANDPGWVLNTGRLPREYGVEFTYQWH